MLSGDVRNAELRSWPKKSFRSGLEGKSQSHEVVTGDYREVTKAKDRFFGKYI